MKKQTAYTLAAGVIVLLILAFVGAGAPSVQKAPETTESTASQGSAYTSRVDYEQAIIDAVDKVSPAIVSITVSKNVPIIERCPTSPFRNLPPGFEDFFGGFEFSQPCQRGTQLQEVGGGSGFMVTADGMIVTNKHVVDDEAASYTVFTNDGKKYTAKVLARDPIQDVAIIKIEGGNFPTLSLGDSDGIKLGQTVIAIGNALAEFRNTVSVGIVSGLARNIVASTQGGSSAEQLEGVIQTDAAINPGNSGGPLINLRGEVIGINTAVVSGANNIGFALPINNVKRDIESVKATGRILVPYMGVRYILLNEEIARRDGISVSQGALVRGGEEGPAIAPGSPAAKAGILAEDVITAVNGTAIDANRSLVSLVQRYKVGDTITLSVLRGDQKLTLRLKLEERK